MTDIKVDVLKESMLKYVPQLEQDYKDYVRKTFDSMTDDLGVSLKGVYNSRRWARSFAGIRDNLSQNIVNGQLVSYVVNDEYLDRNAKRYGESVALAWYNKMQSKLGVLDDVTVSDPRAGGSVTIEGHYKANKVTVEQHPIINVSSRGVLFHQFPARIYVNGKFQSESQYKKTIQGWGVPEVKRDDKPKRPKIDPNTRPKQYRFEYKADYHDVPGRPGVKGIIRQESVRGMTEDEAWEKHVKREVGSYPGKFFSRIYDKKLLAVYAWNDVLLWRRSADDDSPPLEFDPEVAQAKRVSRRRAVTHGHRSRSVASQTAIRGIRR